MIAALIILQTFMPSTPANVIYLGEHLPPIHADRSRCESLTGFCMSVTLTEFLQLKDIAQNTPNMCRRAVDQTSTACAKSAAELAEVVSQREQDDADLIKSYQIQVNTLDTKINRLNAARARWKWGAYSAGAVAVITSTILVIKGL